VGTGAVLIKVYAANMGPANALTVVRVKITVACAKGLSFGDIFIIAYSQKSGITAALVTKPCH